jgi:hypothetical protein
LERNSASKETIDLVFGTAFDLLVAQTVISSDVAGKMGELSDANQEGDRCSLFRQT